MKFLEIYKIVNEEIKAGHKNEEIWLEYLQKNYSKVDVEKYYITFVAVDKVGINPQTPYETPIGVYTYPLKFVLEEEHVPFRGDNSSNKIKILKRVSENGLTINATDKELEACEKLMTEKYNISERDITFDKDTKGQRNNNFGKIWNITRKCADRINRQNNRGKALIPKSISLWTKLFLELGYDYAEDDGKGIIHPAESTQAVFFTPKSYKVIDEVFLDTASKYQDANKKFIKVDLWSPTTIKEVLKNKQFQNLLVTDDDGQDALLSLLKHTKKDSDIFETVYKYSIKHQKEDELIFDYLYSLFDNPDLNSGTTLLKYAPDLMDLIQKKKITMSEEHKKFFKRFIQVDELEEVFPEFFKYISSK